MNVRVTTSHEIINDLRVTVWTLITLFWKWRPFFDGNMAAKNWSSPLVKVISQTQVTNNAWTCWTFETNVSVFPNFSDPTQSLDLILLYYFITEPNSDDSVPHTVEIVHDSSPLLDIPSNTVDSLDNIRIQYTIPVSKMDSLDIILDSGNSNSSSCNMYATSMNMFQTTEYSFHQF